MAIPTDSTAPVPSVSYRRLVLHSLAVILAAASVLASVRHFYFTGMKASDGLTYTTVARNYSEGRGLVSYVIQPGLIDVVPSGRDGQAFVLQAPLWPILLGEWFKIFGASFEAMHLLNGLLYCIAALQCWWLGYLMSRHVAVAYLSAALFLGNPWILGSILLGMNVGVQAVLFGSVFLLLFCRPGAGVVLGAGVLVGLGILARENSVFCLAPIALVWYWRGKESSQASNLLGFLTCKKELARWVASVAAATAIAFALSSLESARKAELIGRWDSPVFRMTFLYGTSAARLQWHYLYGVEEFQIRPIEFFWQHPDELIGKMFYMLHVGFVKQTLPMLLSTAGLFVPIVFPWVLRDVQGRRVALGLLLMIACQLALGSMSSLHFSYFFAYLPVLCALVAATAFELFRRARAWRQPGFAAPICAALCVYALMPIVCNGASLLSGRAYLGGDLNDIAPSQEARLIKFVRDNTPADAIVACCTYNSAYVPWHTRRTVLQYNAVPPYRISNSDMWRRIDERIPIDYVLMTSISAESRSMEMLAGFELVHSLEDPDLQLWLYRRTSR